MIQTEYKDIYTGPGEAKLILSELQETAGTELIYYSVNRICPF